MREFTLNIIGHALSIIEDRDIDMPGAFEVAMSSDASFQDIADYGKSIIGKFHVWALQQDSDALRKPASAKSNARSGAERLDLVAGQIIHHLRQLYSILENFGIPPENRVQDNEWPSEYVLTILW